MLASPSAFDFRLQPSSIGIDVCDSNNAVPLVVDPQGFVRGYDEPSVTNVNGTYDVGAFEFIIDVIFESDFESDIRIHIVTNSGMPFSTGTPSISARLLMS
jgi:hypothetical protein